MSSTPRPASAPTDDAWSGLVKTALLGTERSNPPEWRGGESRAANLVAQIDRQDREAALLSAAAIVHLHARCGTILPKLDTPDEQMAKPCEVESLSRCTSAATAFLRRMLQGECYGALPEFLAALAANRLRIPEEFLAALFDRGKKESRLRTLLRPVAGQRGEWLAALNPDWNYLGETIDRESWLTAAGASRALFFQTLRKSDPKEARELLAASWAEESGEQRAAFLLALADGLSPADELFLDAALDDRKKEVRRTAAELLARIPDSAWSKRMAARLLPSISVQRASRLGGLLAKKPVLQVALPEVCDDAMQRDGIEPKPPQGKGEKAWWLGQMIGLVAPSMWNRHLALTPEECVEAIAKSEWEETLLTALAASARLHRDREWAEALFRCGLKLEKDVGLLSLVDLVSPDLQRATVLDALKKDRDQLGYNHPGLKLLRQCPAPWDESVARAVLHLLREQAEKILDGKVSLHWHWLPEPESFALSMPVSLAKEAEEGWPAEGLPPAPARALATVLEMLRFRSQMLKEIHP